MVVPKSLVPEVLTALHDSPSTGHMGVTRPSVQFVCVSIGPDSERMLKIGFNTASNAPLGKQPGLVLLWSAVYLASPPRESCHRYPWTSTRDGKPLMYINKCQSVSSISTD